jgi:hypothetical protein
MDLQNQVIWQDMKVNTTWKICEFKDACIYVDNNKIPLDFHKWDE